MAGKITLYHYTTKEGKEGISQSGVIYESKKSGSNKDDARFGNGVYLTSLPPSSGKIQLALNNWDGHEKYARNLINWGWVNSYVVVDLDPVDVEQVASDRDIYKFPGDLVLKASMNPRAGDVVKK